MLMRAAIIACLIGCGSNKPHASAVSSEPLDAKRQVYLAALPSVQDEHGFVDVDQCDSLQHSALIGATGVRVDVKAAMDPSISGRYYRRPFPHYPECHSA